MIAKYRRLFLSRKTFLTGFIAALILLPVSFILQALSGGLTIFKAADTLLLLFMLLGLSKAYRHDDLIEMNGWVSGILMLELCRYAYIAEQLLSVGKEQIVSLGFYSCMTLSGYLMICFILVLLSFNHFNIDLRKVDGRTHVLVNQLALMILLLCFVWVTLTSIKTDGDFAQHLMEAVSFTADIALFVDVACCELTICIDSVLLRQ